MDENKVTVEEPEPERRCLHVNKYMIPAKVSYFVSNARYSITDYFMLFYTSTGLTPTQAGFINGIQYIGGLLANPVWGYLADKTGRHRSIIWFLCTMAVCAVCVQPLLGAQFSPATNVCPANITSNVSPVVVPERNSLFYSLLMAAILASSFDSTIMSFVDAGVLQRVRTSGAEIGMQRYAASLGTSFGSIAYCFSVHYFPAGSVSCYGGLLITYLVLAVCTGVCSHFLYKDIVMPKESKSSKTNTLLWTHIKNFDTIFFFFSVLLNGTMQALFFSFLFLYLKQLGAPTLLFGFSMSVNCVSAITVYVLSEKVIHILRGPYNAMCFSCFMWGLRFLSTSFLQNPFIIFVIDIFHGFTFSLFKVASFQHVKDTTDERISTTVCGIVTALYMCCSFCLANVIGGKLFEDFGAKRLYTGGALICFGWTLISVAYALVRKYFPRTKGYEQLE